MSDFDKYIREEEKHSHHEHGHSHSHHHSHHHSHSHNHSHSASVKDLKIAFFLNAFFTIIEFAAGIFTNSSAVLADAVHDLGDTVSIGGTVWFEKYSMKQKDAKFAYGYRRFSPFAALINCIILFSGAVFMLSEAIPRLWNPETVKSDWVIAVAVVGIVFNGIGVLRLSGGHSHTKRTVMFHLLEDVLGWVAVLIGSIVMYFTNWTLIDPLLSIAICMFIIYNASRNFISVSKIFLQAVPKEHNYEYISHEILKNEKIKNVHDIRSWTMDGNSGVMSLHVTVADASTKQDIISVKKFCAEIIKKEGIEHFTISVDYETEECDFNE